MTLVEIEGLYDKGMLAIIGEIAVNTEMMADIIDFGIWLIVAKEKTHKSKFDLGRRITRDLDLSERIKLLKKLVLVLHPEEEGEKTELARVMSKAASAATIRNKRIHALWTTRFTESGVKIETRHGRDKDKEEEVTIETLKFDASEILRALIEICEFLKSKGIWPGPSGAGSL